VRWLDSRITGQVRIGTHFTDKPFDRHRGGGHPPTPATPPCVQVCTRRFESVTLASVDQDRKAARLEVGTGEALGESLGPGQIPGTMPADRGAAPQPRPYP